MTSFSGLYIDTNTLIYAFEGERTNDNLAIQSLIETLGWHALETSELTLSEILVRPLQEGDQPRVKRYKALLQRAGNGYLKVRPVSTSVLVEAAWHRAAQKKSGPDKVLLLDMIHVATATFWGCSHFMTGDDRMRLPDHLQRVRPVSADINALLGLIK